MLQSRLNLTWKLKWLNLNAIIVEIKMVSVIFLTDNLNKQLCRGPWREVTIIKITYLEDN